MTKSNYTLAFRRKREGRTNYKKRLALLKSSKTRLVVRKSLTATMLQLVEYHPDGDKVLSSVSSRDLTKLGWKAAPGNLASAYLAGLLLGKKAKDAKIEHAVLDIGLNVPIKGSRLFASVKGVLDSGLVVPCSKEIFPSEDRISGKHVATYAANLQKSNQDEYNKRFSVYVKNGLQPEKLPEHFNEIKTKILKE
jgi:large subunit ribosomal protein L18